MFPWRLLHAEGQTGFQCIGRNYKNERFCSEVGRSFVVHSALCVWGVGRDAVTLQAAARSQLLDLYGLKLLLGGWDLITAGIVRTFAVIGVPRCKVIPCVGSVDSGLFRVTVLAEE